MLCNSPKRLRSNEFESSIWWQMWKILTVRASRISFCPLCIHDF